MVKYIGPNIHTMFATLHSTFSTFSMKTVQKNFIAEHFHLKYESGHHAAESIGMNVHPCSISLSIVIASE
jgi:hypothetical protein